jgi:hypothetical protein
VSGKTSVNVLLYQGPTTDPVAVATNNISCTAVPTVAAADMNKDGKLDVVLGCTEGVALELYGNGDGTFQTPVIALLNGPAANMTIGDFNADGYPDLAVLINNVSYSIATLLNQGGASAGTLTPAGTRSLPNSPTTSAKLNTGDFNGDGKLDVLVASYNAPYVSFGNGDGTLQVPQSMAATGCARVEVGDFNHDGITDAACVNSDHADLPTFSLQVLQGSSSGQFAVASSLPLASDSIPVAIGNNGDGNLDLAVMGITTSILLGDGHGAFSFGQSYAITGTPIAVNPDDNGKASLVFYSNLNGSYALRYLTANGDGTFRALPASQSVPT